MQIAASFSLIFCLIAACSENESLYARNLVPQSTYLERSTSSEIALTNLDAQIKGLEAGLRKRPQTFFLRKNLAHLLRLRSKLLGTYSKDFNQLLKVSGEAVKRDPKSFEALLLQAEVLSALHRFQEASSYLQRASNEGATDYQLKSLRESIDLARGDNGLQIATERRISARDQPSFNSLADSAIAEAVLGNYEKADELYAQAISLYRNSSPFPLAIINFQRGVMWCEMAGDCRRALQFYRNATELVPQYVSANVHLAELEITYGEISSAVGRMNSTANRTSDPEPAALLSQIYFMSGDLAQGYAWRDRAKKMYDRLLSDHEAAFRDHAAEFFMSIGANAKRALQLALANLDNRKNERAYSLAITASLVEGQSQRACKLASEVRSPVTAPLQNLIAEELAGQCF